ncbi:alpha/beta hydrolase [Motilimonas sp. 1_MG-2023]|uniref:alpha/beta hydrolase n=1 Tax=Motilimonas TaxID=1914248 RepID=UPI0026E2360F|nr:alpha/beta hydrolase-fold protein [Motilimonas sp. 1_MG-2023]MDO6526730.1 alpha/beta hydrolase-fold protein [Motilimonas sp. 1_MG-2023]
MKSLSLSLCALSIVASSTAMAWNNTEYSHTNGLVERIQVYGESLENNVVGDYASREVFVYLPPSYYENDEKNYPVVYVLHGLGGTAQGLFANGENDPNLDKVMDELIASGDINEMILVVPDTYNYTLGSWYQNSAVTGNWQEYLLDDLIPTIDERFRTIDDAEGRGILGHSMGGYGAISTVLAEPEEFSALAAMSPSFLVNDFSPSLCGYFYSLQMDTLQNWNGNPSELSYDTYVTFSLMQLSSPDLNNPPSYVKKELGLQDLNACAALDLPSQISAQQPSVEDFGHIAVRTEIGNQEMLTPATYQVSELLKGLGMQTSFNEFEGGHLDKLSVTIYDNIKFMSANLAAPELDD